MCHGGRRVPRPRTNDDIFNDAWATMMALMNNGEVGDRQRLTERFNQFQRELEERARQEG